MIPPTLGRRSWLVLRSSIVFVSGTLAVVASGGADPSLATIRVFADRSLGPIDPRIYGHFTEMTLSSFEGSVSSELLFNRKFEIQEERTSFPPLFVGVADGWEPIALDTDVTFAQDRNTAYSPSYSQRITLSDPSDVPAGIQQGGYRFVMPHVSRNQRLDDAFVFEAGVSYTARIAIRSRDFHGRLHVALGTSHEDRAASLTFEVTRSQDWRVYSGKLIPERRVEAGTFMVFIESPGTLWIDSVSLVCDDQDEGGFRRDVLELTERLTPTSIRWPGGWFVSDYPWRDGIGPGDRRPARFNRAWNVYTTNDVGTDEFIALCRRLGAEPYIAVNFGTGTPEEAAQWVEYCNGGPETPMGRLRAQNGHPEPYGVRDWNIGNEEYLPTLGGTSGRQYGRQFNAFADAMRAVDPSINLVAVGAFDIPRGALPRSHPAWRVARFLPGWTEGVLEEAGRSFDYYSIHYYKPEKVRGHDPQDVDRAALVLAEDLARKIDRLHEQMARHAPGSRRYPIALDEWSVVVEDDPTPLKLPEGVDSPAEFGLRAGGQTLRDALAEATVFNLMHRRPRDFAIGSRTLLYAFLRGLIAIRRDGAISTPPALMMELYSAREVHQSVETEVVSDRFATKAMNPGFGAVKGAPYLDVSARAHRDGETLDLFVVNRHLTDAIQASVRLEGFRSAGTVETATLHARELLAWNGFEDPDRVAIQLGQVRVRGSSFGYRFPEHSLVRLRIRRDEVSR